MHFLLYVKIWRRNYLKKDWFGGVFGLFWTLGCMGFLPLFEPVAYSCCWKWWNCWAYAGSDGGSWGGPDGGGPPGYPPGGPFIPGPLGGTWSIIGCGPRIGPHPGEGPLFGPGPMGPGPPGPDPEGSPLYGIRLPLIFTFTFIWRTKQREKYG